MSELPAKLADLVGLFDLVPEREGRIELLIQIADRFRSVPDHVATRPFPESNRIKECESESYVWAEEQADGTLKFHFAVENPQGISAMATAVLLDDGLSGEPLSQVAAVDPEIIYRFFGRELSMGKSMGLTGMVNRVRALAKAQLSKQGG